MSDFIKCKDCGFYEKESGMCIDPNNPMNAELKTKPDIRELNFFGSITMVDYGKCEDGVTPDSADIILSGGIMKCSDCVHHDTIRGYHLCFGFPENQTITEPYNSLTAMTPRKEPYEIKAEISEGYWSVCHLFKRKG